MWKFLNLETEFKDINESGTFSGYAAVFGNIDHGGDVIERGAFKEINKRQNGKVVILNQHNTRDPIGVADVKQDDKGLAFEGKLILEAASARQAHALMKGGALDGMSIGYSILEGGAKLLESGVRQLKALGLHEISPVTFGMNSLAGIDSVKSLSTIREFETFLRDVGMLSHAEAKAVASGGWSALGKARDESADEGKALLNILSNFKVQP